MDTECRLNNLPSTITNRNDGTRVREQDIYIYIERERERKTERQRHRERERERDREREREGESQRNDNLYRDWYDCKTTQIERKSIIQKKVYNQIFVKS